jgi:hypothetical protein
VGAGRRPELDGMDLDTRHTHGDPSVNPRFPVGYLDLDGVLVNFVKGALALHDRFLPMSQVRWGFNDQLGIPWKEFIAPMGHDFWAGLEWTPEGKKFLGHVENIFSPENLVLLSSPIPTRGSADGKIAWVEREMPRYKRQYLLGTGKDLAACSTKILIDDRQENVDDFVKAGGHAILVPRPWNSRRAETSADGSFDPAAVARQVAELHLNVLRDMR